jgi:phosphoglycolate phosphatase
MNHAIIFDFDGTLINSAPSILNCLKLALEKNRISPLHPVTADIIGPPLRVTLAHLSGSNNANLIDTLVTDFKDYYDNGLCQDTLAYAGITDLLFRLQQHSYDLYLATNKRGVPTKLILDHLCWNSFFHGVYCLDEQSDCKDKPQMLNRILTENHLVAMNTPYIGDTNGDALAAHCNSMPYIHVSWGYGYVSEVIPHTICTQPTELLGILDRTAWT